MTTKTKTSEQSPRIVVAIDGHSSCGKSTMARTLAAKVGYIYVDTGAMYRAVTLYALRHEQIDKPEALHADIEAGKVHITFAPDGHTLLCGEDVESLIRSPQVSALVSRIAAQPPVRAFLVKEQQAMGADKGIVMDGRDIGTTVFPQAELKVFITATPQVRAQRRYDELVAKGHRDIRFEDILANVQERDYIDAHRSVSPLRKADDALLLDNSTLTPAQQDEWLLHQFHARTAH